MIDKITMRAARVNAGLTQTQMAKKMEVSISTVHLWETGKVRPKPPQVLMFSMICGVKPEDIKFF